MAQIPKDGKSYMAWHKSYGACMVSWSGDGEDIDVVNVYRATFTQDGVFVIRRIVGIEEIERWQDRFGRWNELKDPIDSKGECNPFSLNDASGKFTLTLEKNVDDKVQAYLVVDSDTVFLGNFTNKEEANEYAINMAKAILKCVKGAGRL